MRKNSKKALCYIILMSISSLIFAGCGVVDRLDSLNGILEDAPPSHELGELKKGEKAFFDKDYNLAEKIFSDVYKKSDIEVYKNQGLYGFACVQMMVAENAEDYKIAYNLLERWTSPTRENAAYRENPRMLIEALGKKDTFSDCETTVKYVTSKQTASKQDDTVVKEQEMEIAALKEEIKKLQHQISVLEAIDQEVQEKRKPL